jgi:hypothetical protein
MKRLNAEQLDQIVGGEPHGTDANGRQTDGYDITSSKLGNYGGDYGDSVMVHYSNGTKDLIEGDGTFTRYPRGY